MWKTADETRTNKLATDCVGNGWTKENGKFSDLTVQWCHTV